MPPQDQHPQHPAPSRSRYTTSTSSGRHRRDAWRPGHRVNTPGHRLLAPAVAAAFLAAAAAVGFLGGPGEPDYTGGDARAFSTQATASATAPSTAAESAGQAAPSRTPATKRPSQAPSPKATPSKTAKSATPKASPSPTPAAKSSPAKAELAKIKVAAVAGLTQAQMDNAAIIVQVSQSLGLPQRAAVIAVATAMQESSLYNLASHVVPSSLNYPHQGTGADHDSVGLFQQRASGSWGTVKEIMTPADSAKAFYRALVRVDGWQDMALTRAAQKVQVSAYPDAYAKHEDNATQVVNAILP